MSTPADIPTVVAKRSRTIGAVTTYTIDCPYCGREHTHGSPPGHRLSHCAGAHKPNRGYFIAAPVTEEPRP